MSDIISKIYEDIDDYIELCNHFDEEVRYRKDAYGIANPDCYGEHSKSLKKRMKKYLKKRNK